MIRVHKSMTFVVKFAGKVGTVIVLATCLAACLSRPVAPEAVHDFRSDGAVYVRVQCPANYRLMFERHGVIQRRLALECAEHDGRLVAFDTGPGVYELILKHDRDRVPERWGRNLFKVDESLGTYYWGDITVSPRGEVKVHVNPETIAEIKRRRAGRPFDRARVGVTFE